MDMEENHIQSKDKASKDKKKVRFADSKPKFTDPSIHSAKSTEMWIKKIPEKEIDEIRKKPPEKEMDYESDQITRSHDQIKLVRGILQSNCTYKT